MDADRMSRGKEQLLGIAVLRWVIDIFKEDMGRKAIAVIVEAKKLSAI